MPTPATRVSCLGARKCRSDHAIDNPDPFSTYRTVQHSEQYSTCAMGSRAHVGAPASVKTSEASCRCHSLNRGLMDRGVRCTTVRGKKYIVTVCIPTYNVVQVHVV